MSNGPSQDTLRRKILAWFISRGERGGTDEECQIALRLSHQSQTVRRWELLGGDTVRDSGKRRMTRTDTPAIVWVATGRSYDSVAWSAVCKAIRGEKARLRRENEELRAEIAQLKGK
jgi:hypothetical protein